MRSNYRGSETPWIKLGPKDDAIILEIERERARGAALIAAALVDERLEQTIKLRLRREITKADKDSHALLFRRNGALASNFARIQLGYLLQLYPAEIRELFEVVNDIRNKFAHETEPITFRARRIVDSCAVLNQKMTRATMAASIFLQVTTPTARNPNPRSFQVPGQMFSVTTWVPSSVNSRAIYLQTVKVLLYFLARARDIYANDFVTVSPPPLPGTPAPQQPKAILRRKGPGKGRKRRSRSSRA